MSPSIVGTSSGQAIASWLQCDGARLLATAATFDGQRWTPSTTLGFGFDGLMSAFVRPGGNGFAFWSGGQEIGFSGPKARYVSAFDTRRGWGAPRLLEDVQITETASAVGDGQTVLWPASDFFLDVSRFRPDGSWMAAESLHLGNEARPGLAASVDDAGNAIVVWLRSQCCVDDLVVDTVWSARFDVRRGWDVPHAWTPSGVRGTRSHSSTWIGRGTDTRPGRLARARSTSPVSRRRPAGRHRSG
jgi:hypothetical protein